MLKRGESRPNRPLPPLLDEDDARASNRSAEDELLCSAADEADSLADGLAVLSSEQNCERMLLAAIVVRRSFSPTAKRSRQTPSRSNGKRLQRVTEVNKQRLTLTVQLRRQARQRREFLYNKALEAKSKQIYERKQRVKDLLAKGKEVPKRDAVGERESAMDAAQEGADSPVVSQQLPMLTRPHRSDDSH